MNAQIELDNLMQFTPEDRARILMRILRNVLQQAESDPYLTLREIESHIENGCHGEKP